MPGNKAPPNFFAVRSRTSEDCGDAPFPNCRVVKHNLFRTGAAGPNLSLRHNPTQLLRRGPVGLPSPQVHGQLAGQRDNQLLLAPGMTAQAQQNRRVFFSWRIIGLIKDEAPSQFNEQPSHAAVARLGNTQVQVARAAAADRAAKSGVTAHMTWPLEALPSTEFRQQRGKGQRSKTFGPNLGCVGFHSLSQLHKLFLDGLEQGAPDFQLLTQPVRQARAQGGPPGLLPPGGLLAPPLSQ